MKLSKRDLQRKRLESRPTCCSAHCFSLSGTRMSDTISARNVKLLYIDDARCVRLDKMALPLEKALQLKIEHLQSLCKFMLSN